MSNVVVLDNLLSDLLSVKGRDIISTYNNLTGITGNTGPEGQTGGSYGKFKESYDYLSRSAGATGLSGPRLLFSEADGTVLYDSGRRSVTVGGTTGVNLNTFENYLKKNVNENHNSRLAIIKSLLSASGRGYEVKRSTTTGSTETYVSSRLGSSSENAIGTVRISYTVD
jgi:hypothetical protein